MEPTHIEKFAERGWKCGQKEWGIKHAEKKMIGSRWGTGENVPEAGWSELVKGYLMEREDGQYKEYNIWVSS